WTSAGHFRAVFHAPSGTMVTLRTHATGAAEATVTKTILGADWTTGANTSPHPADPHGGRLASSNRHHTDQSCPISVKLSDSHLTPRPGCRHRADRASLGLSFGVGLAVPDARCFRPARWRSPAMITSMPNRNCSSKLGYSSAARRVVCGSLSGDAAK